MKEKNYINEDNDGLSNGEEGESDQDCNLFMEFEDKCNNEFDGLEEKSTFIEKFDRNISDEVIVTYVIKYSSLGETHFLVIKNEEHEA